MKQKSIFVANVSTEAITDTDTAVYTVPANARAKWVLAFLSNASGSTGGGGASPITGVSLWVNNSANIPILFDKTLTAGEVLQFDSAGGYIMLESGYQVRARADDAGVSCVLTIEESTGLVSTN